MEKFQSEIKFDANGLIPAIVQDADTDEVLMLAYVNEESLRLDIVIALKTLKRMLFRVSSW